ncbi:hypothetical protein DFP95_1351 [Cohnella lupini]|uniref:Uncharacterized protein n=1 Tax=Cohnella lupini TaxID=1294267 RepID=A0A3D9HR09_9BACL|nr:hypothetical protein DFP95_1351 [Cohnella lupini]
MVARWYGDRTMSVHFTRIEARWYGNRTKSALGGRMVARWYGDRTMSVHFTRIEARLYENGVPQKSKKNARHPVFELDVF